MPSACRLARAGVPAEISLDYPGQAMPVQVQVQDGSSASLCSRTGASWSWTWVIRGTPPVRRQERRRLSPRSPPGLQYASGRRQSAASQSASRSIARSRIRGDGGISGLGGCKIGSLPGLVQAGNAGPRSP